MRRMTMRLLASFVAVTVTMIACSVVSASAGVNIVVKPDAVEPPLLRTTTGERVEFVNRTGRHVHVQFAGDARGHQVVQIPASGPIWVVFHRPGPHPYVIHFYEPNERTLTGVVEVAENVDRPSEPSTCAITAMGTCIEP